MAENFILNPSWFYWLSVVDKIQTALFVLAVLCGIVGVVAMLVWLIGVVCFDEEVTKTIKQTILVSGIVGFTCLIAVIFIPGKETLIEMQIARYATHENVEIATETVKEAVDYIINAIKGANAG